MSDDDPLQAYREKRHFEETPEPQGGSQAVSDRPIFVFQKHEASSLHYDFRLEVDGVLKSWAVPKGPSTDPSEKRLALPTEDHPLEYADFEGVIPEGEYGAGTVMVWDIGPYQNLRAEKEEDGLSMSASHDDGQIEVWLEGEKLQGGYALVRTDSGDNERWLLIKMDDDEADARRNPTSTEPKSVLSDRTLDEIAAEEDE
ncbi:MAG: DNA polymerase ligase N-terminal domain-containing protein [Candidatus Promineifilaceae bacterium]|nr:DNA polymerase ligase N-terminal domain-containing protein [Candidatus Promineifilaceae bacterium]